MDRSIINQKFQDSSLLLSLSETVQNGLCLTQLETTIDRLPHDVAHISIHSVDSTTQVLCFVGQV